MNDGADLKSQPAPLAEALLPAGFADMLPADAEHEAALTQGLLHAMTLHGYRRVAPPLVEFETSLNAGAGASNAASAFRMLDPVSQAMMALRPDMTPQIARIAATRLRRAPRPLRLCYAGPVLRVDRDQLRPERQFAQVGAELIGGDRIEGDVEILTMCVEALAALGVAGISVDVTAPTLVDAALAPFGFDAAQTGAVRDALDHKDAAAAARAAGPAAAMVDGLIRAGGPLDRAAAALDALDLSPAAAIERDQLVALGRALRAAAPDLPITIDPAERKGFHYHAGPSFSLFAQGVRGELGRGGRYRVGAQREEAAIGATLYIDSVSRAAPRVPPEEAVYIPYDAPDGVAAALRSEGRIAITALQPESGDSAAEARRLGCASQWTPDGVTPV